MIIFNRKIENDVIDGWMEYAEMFAKIKVSPEKFKYLCEKYPEPGKYLIESSIEMGFDTGEREMFMDLIAMEFTGMLAPLYGDSQEIKDKFNKRFDRAASKLTNGEWK